MSPEYVVDGLFSIKSDVYSFGVMVLEIVSGKKNRGYIHPDHQLNLLGHVSSKHKLSKTMLYFCAVVDMALYKYCLLSKDIIESDGP